MPRYLYLLRHAQSADKQRGQTDKERELTPLGFQQSLRIAGFLIQEKTFPDAIMCSTSERTKATTSLIADAIKYDPSQIFYFEELYEASTRTLFNFVSQLEDNLHQVMLVGHNPSISYLAEYLTKAEIGEMVPTGMSIIQLNIASWREISAGNGELIRYLGNTY
jgi:phosphohistidine phosphatase